MNKDKIFNDEEVSQLLQRAIERQEADKQHKFDAAHGLTLEEIERIAADAGIDPRYIRLALADQGSREDSPFHPGFWGAPPKIEIVRDVPGHLSDAGMASMLSEIRTHFAPHKGDFEKVGSRFEWRHSPTLGPMVISGEPKGENTELTLTVNTGQAAFLFHFLASFFPFFFGLMSTLTGKFPLGLPLAIGVIIMIFTVMRWQLSRYAQKQLVQLETLMDNISNVAYTPPEEETPWTYGESDTASKPQINLNEANRFLNDEEQIANRKKTRT